MVVKLNSKFNLITNSNLNLIPNNIILTENNNTSESKNQ